MTTTIIAIVVTLGLIVFMVRKPKLFFGLIGFGLLLAGLIYLILNLSSSSSEQKKKMLREDDTQFETER